MGNLSEHFTEEELTFSDTAIKYGASNKPSAIHLKTLKHTCEYGLEPLRKLFNAEYVGKVLYGKTVKAVTIKITSGYRSIILTNKFGKCHNKRFKQIIKCILRIVGEICQIKIV